MRASKVKAPMGFAKRAIVVGGVGFAASALVGCGSGGGLLSSDQASRLNAELEQASAALSAGRCQQAATAAQNFQNSAQNLGGVDQKLVSNLEQGASTIAQLTTHDCRATQPPSRSKSNTTTSTSTVTSTTTTSTPTTTTPTTTTVMPPLPTSPSGGGGLDTTTTPVIPPTDTPGATTTLAGSATTPTTGTSGGTGLVGPGTGNQQ